MYVYIHAVLLQYIWITMIQYYFLDELDFHCNFFSFCIKLMNYIKGVVYQNNENVLTLRQSKM